MREKKYHIYLTDDEQSRVIQSLINLKNNLIVQGRYTDAEDDVLLKVLSAKKKKLIIALIYQKENLIFYEIVLYLFCIHQKMIMQDFTLLVN